MNKPFLGFHYDIARGTYLKPDVFCRALRLAAESGYTHFLPYLENMIRLPAMERACPDCAYTAADWARFQTVAQEAGIELVPHFNAIGHTELISPAYPELCGPADGASRPDFDVENPATCAWLLRCLSEFCAISQSEYFLIGGDEWQPPRHLLGRDDFDVAQAWVRQINAAVDFLAQRGRQPIVWHDMLMHYPAARAALSRQAVIAFWFYDYDSDYAALSTFKELGFKTLMASAVFNGGMPMLGRRSVNALHCAVEAASRHCCNGFMVTSWEGCRWELESFNIPMASRVLRGEEPPAVIVNALALIGAWSKVPSESIQGHQWQSTLTVLLNEDAWAAVPELRRLLCALLQRDTAANVASYRQSHYPQGLGYECAANPARPRDWSVAPTTTTTNEIAFGLTVARDERRGEVLQFGNARESFVVYPRYGASLQDWQHAGTTIIPATLEKFLQRDARPGGYRSYAAAGGFRPIWAMGTHSNPCILWQHPWTWRIVTQTPAQVAVELKLELPHGIFTVGIAIERGQPGFMYEARCVNRLEHAFGAFNFNLPLAFGLDDLTNLKLVWSDHGQPREATVAGQGESAFWIPARGPLTMRRPGGSLHIDAAAAQTAGYFVDWNVGCITPDLHGIYRPLEVGEETVTSWRFRPEPMGGR